MIIGQTLANGYPLHRESKIWSLKGKRFPLYTLVMVAGLIVLGMGLWIPVKAVVAQALLKSAWARSEEGLAPVKPWPWADMWPVARMMMPQAGIDWVILSGDDGPAMAFAPGHNPGSALPGEGGLAVVSGHRDTHFKFLEKIELGDEIRIERGGESFLYRVFARRVVDAREVLLQDDEAGDQLALVTCFPFGAINAGGPLRLVVLAELEDVTPA